MFPNPKHSTSYLFSKLTGKNWRIELYIQLRSREIVPRLQVCTQYDLTVIQQPRHDFMHMCHDISSGSPKLLITKSCHMTKPHQTHDFTYSSISILSQISTSFILTTRHNPSSLNLYFIYKTISEITFQPDLWNVISKLAFNLIYCFGFLKKPSNWVSY